MNYSENPEPISPIAHLETLRRLLTEAEYHAVISSTNDVLSRLVMGRILTDPKFIPVRELPDTYLPKISEFIDELLIEKDIMELIDHSFKRRMRALLLRGQARGSHTAVIADATFLNVARALLQEGMTEVRCRACGYHFRYSDMNEKRRNMLGSLDLRLASFLDTRREADEIKRPIMTGLEVDHIEPRTGWGPTDAANLQFLCQLCNQGKSIYSAALESLSIISAGSYSLHYGVDYFPNRAIFYSTLRYWKSTCRLCGSNAKLAELTAIPRAEWFTPWTCDVVCYSCVE